MKINQEFFGLELNTMDFLSFDPETEKSIYYKNIPDDPTSVSENRIWTFYEDSKNNLWIGTVSAGLNKFDRVNKKFTRYLHNPK